MVKRKNTDISPEEALQFLDDMMKLSNDIDEKTVAISLRVPENLLRALKVKAKVSKRKYQSLLIDYIRQGLKSDP